jgi:hypothetical protein
MRSKPLQMQSTQIFTYTVFIIIIFYKLKTAKHSPILSSSTAAAAATSSPSSSSSSSVPPPPLLPPQLQQRKWLNCKCMSSSPSNSKFPLTKTAT